MEQMLAKTLSEPMAAHVRVVDRKKEKRKMTTDNTPSLEELGWSPFFSRHFESLQMPDALPARVVSERRGAYRVYSKYGELSAEVSGRMRYQAATGDRYPAIGDWVVIRPHTDGSKAVIHGILPRKSKFSRKEPGIVTNEQIIAANVDVVFVVSALDGGRSLSPGRIERYLSLTWGGGALPVIVLNKVDLCPDVAACVQEVEPVAPGVPIYPVSATERTGLDALRGHLARGLTAAFLGSSGVGKSALINALLGADRQEVGGVRQSDGKGRHTTSGRDLVLLPDGGAVIDTPGLREIQMWTDEAHPQESFQDVEALAGVCRFRDCRHHSEPGCAIKAAIRAGDLDAGRLQGFEKLQKELDHLARRQDHRARLDEKARWKQLSQWSKENRKHRD